MFLFTVPVVVLIDSAVYPGDDAPMIMIVLLGTRKLAVPDAPVFSPVVAPVGSLAVTGEFKRVRPVLASLTVT